MSWLLLASIICISLVAAQHFPESLRRLSKRQAIGSNNDLTSNYFAPFDSKHYDFPIESVFPMGRPQKRGRFLPVVQFVAFWVDDNLSFHVGGIRILHDSVQAEFIVNGSIITIADKHFDNDSVLVLQSPDNQFASFKFKWILAKNARPETLISFYETDENDVPITPAVYKPHQNWEYYGIADVASESIQFVKNGTVHIVEGDEFNEKVYLLTKAACRC